MFERKGIPIPLFNGPVFSTEISVAHLMPAWAFWVRKTFLENRFLLKQILCCAGTSALSHVSWSLSLQVVREVMNPGMSELHAELQGT